MERTSSQMSFFKDLMNLLERKIMLTITRTGKEAKMERELILHQVAMSILSPIFNNSSSKTLTEDRKLLRT
jgi:hypothetical protein